MSDPVKKTEGGGLRKEPSAVPKVKRRPWRLAAATDRLRGRVFREER